MGEPKWSAGVLTGDPLAAHPLVRSQLLGLVPSINHVMLWWFTEGGADAVSGGGPAAGDRHLSHLS